MAFVLETESPKLFTQNKTTKDIGPGTKFTFGGI